MFSLPLGPSVELRFHGLLFGGTPLDLVFSISEPTSPYRHQHQHAHKAVQRNQRRDFTPEICPPTHSHSHDSEIVEGRPRPHHTSHPSDEDKRICLPCHFTTSSTTAALNQPAAAAATATAAPIPMKNRQGERTHLKRKPTQRATPPESTYSYTNHIKGTP